MIALRMHDGYGGTSRRRFSMVTMDLEIDELELRYEALRVRRPEKDRRLLASLSEVGQLVPIVVVTPDDRTDRRVVVDGYRRIQALRRLRRDLVVALEWKTSEIDALLLRRSLSSGGGDTSLEQAWLLDELRRRFGVSVEELARNFDRSPELGQSSACAGARAARFYPRPDPPGTDRAARGGEAPGSLGARQS